MIKTGLIGVFVFSFSLFLPHPVSAAAERVFTVSPKPTGGTVFYAGWLNCGDGGEICLARIPLNAETVNATVILEVKPSLNYDFISWEGDCMGKDQCSLPMSSDHLVSAVFRIQSLFTIKRPVHGTVAIYQYSFINSAVVWFPLDACSSTATADACNRYYSPGAVGGSGLSRLKFVATPEAGFSFAGWTDDCSGTGECILDSSQDRTIGANFPADPNATGGIPAGCVDIDNDKQITEIDCGDSQNDNCSAPLCGGANPENPPADEGVLPGSGDGFNPPRQETSVTTSPFSWQITNPFAGGVDSVMGLLAVLANFIFQLGIPVAVIIIIYSGVTYLTAGNTERVKRATHGLKYAALGLAILLIGKGFVALIQSILSIK